MEDLEGANSPPVSNGDMPEALNESHDPLNPDARDEEASKSHSITEVPEVEDGKENDDDNASISDDGDLSDEMLSDVDEDQFKDFDPSAVAIDERRVVDASDVALLGKHKRKRDENEAEPKKKRKEGRRDKLKRKGRSDDEGLEGADGGERRARRPKEPTEKKKRRTPSPENDEHLTPEERRRKNFDKQLDEALRKPKPARRRRAGIDLEAMADNELEDMRRRMAEAAQADTIAREAGKPAMHKLKMLPEVVALLNRNTLQNALVDPEINILESVRFFLEPLNDGSLPAHNIQRELFACLAKLPLTKDALFASGIGKVAYFYTRTKWAEPSIRRTAERLVGEWTRTILQRNDDYRKRELVEADYDPRAAQFSQSSSQNNVADHRAARAAAARKAALATPGLENRARVDGGVQTYTIVPRADLSAGQGVKRLGASGDELFRRLKARHAGRGSGR